MSKKILITGATSGIGFETAKALASKGHHLLVHGRSAEKVESLVADLSSIPGTGPVEGLVADLSDLASVATLAVDVRSKHDSLDVLINNAGVLKTSAPKTTSGLDVRFVVNTFAPALLTRLLRPLFAADGRVINLSSAAQQPVSLRAVAGQENLTDFAAYAQSKLALTMWSAHLGQADDKATPVSVAVNPGSMLSTNMVTKGFGVQGNDVTIGSRILVRAALSDEFASKSGAYFDNDAGRFAPPHADASDPKKCADVLQAIEAHIQPHIPEKAAAG